MKKQWKVASLLALSLTFSPAFLASAAVDKEDVPQTVLVAAVAGQQQTANDEKETNVADKEQVKTEQPKTEVKEKQTKETEQAKKDQPQNEQAKNEQPKTEVAKEVKNLTIEEALELARENNTGLKLAGVERNKDRVAVEQASDQRRHTPESHPFQGSMPKDQLRLNETAKKAAYKVADRKYDVQKVAIELEIKNNYYSVLKNKDLLAVSKAALERAQEQLRQAQVSFEVGTVAKNDVLGAQAVVSSAQARLTAAENNFRLTEIDLSRSIGLPTETHYNLTSIVKHETMPSVDLAKTIAEAQEKRLDVIGAEAATEVAKVNYDFAVGYSGKGTYDAQTARMGMEEADLKLADTKKAVVSDLTRAYLNVQAAQKQLDAYTTAVEQSKEGLRLAKLRYEVGMATSLEVLTASANLEEMEANRVSALYDHNLAVLTFETAKLAPVGA